MKHKQKRVGSWREREVERWKDGDNDEVRWRRKSKYMKFFAGLLYSEQCCHLIRFFSNNKTFDIYTIHTLYSDSNGIFVILIETLKTLKKKKTNKQNKTHKTTTTTTANLLACYKTKQNQQQQEETKTNEK